MSDIQAMAVFVLVIAGSSFLGNATYDAIEKRWKQRTAAKDKWHGEGEG